MNWPRLNELPTLCRAIPFPESMCQKIAMSTEAQPEMDVNEKLNSLKDKLTRTTKFLKELKTLSKNCQEIAVEHQPEDADDEAHREKQVTSAKDWVGFEPRHLF